MTTLNSIMTILKKQESSETLGSAHSASSLAEDIIDVPDWSIVTADELQRRPWRSICAIEVMNSTGDVVRKGTGWLAGPRTIITAAHVVTTAQFGARLTARALFPALRTTVSTAAITRHPQFIGSRGTVDMFDIAALTFTEDIGPALAPIPFAGDKTSVDVAGFPAGPAGPFVTQQESGVRSPSVPALFLHRADTDHGHSGAPVVLHDGDGSKVAALHVHDDDANPDEPLLGARNVALLLRDELLAFITQALTA